MKKYDLLILGPATRDVNIDYTGAEDRSVLTAPLRQRQPEPECSPQ